jgi:DNA-binding NtrC family response regulator
VNIHRIAIIEDDESIRKSLQLILEEAEFQILPFSDPPEALQTFQDTGWPDLILSDFNLPKMSGLEMLEAVRLTYPSLPFLIMTSNPTDYLFEHAFELKVSGFLIKPFQVVRLTDAIEALQEKEGKRSVVGMA